MSCTCVDESGALLDRCIGICSDKNAYLQQQAVIRAYQEDRIEKLLANGLSQIDKRLSQMKTYIEDEYLKGFRAGFEMAKDIYESNCC
jgi:hypothetical protein